MYAQKLAAEFKVLAVHKAYLQYPGFLVQVDFGWFGCVGHEFHTIQYCRSLLLAVVAKVYICSGLHPVPARPVAH